MFKDGKIQLRNGDIVNIPVQRVEVAIKNRDVISNYGYIVRSIPTSYDISLISGEVTYETTVTQIDTDNLYKKMIVVDDLYKLTEQLNRLVEHKDFQLRNYVLYKGSYQHEVDVREIDKLDKEIYSILQTNKLMVKSMGFSMFDDKKHELIIVDKSKI